jgi:outer membrane immunogenic protein
MQDSGEKASNTLPRDPFLYIFIGTFGHPGGSLSGAAVTEYEARISWFGTVRGRVGYTWDSVMIYATGGLAFGEVGLQGTHTVSGSGLTTFSITSSVGNSRVNAGWTVGGGVEAALVGNWTWKAQYLYADLGSIERLGSICTTECIYFGNRVSGGQTTTHTHFTDEIVRLGLNYKFY